MFEQDYLMRQLMTFFKALVNAAGSVEDKEHPDYRAAADMLEDAITNERELEYCLQKMALSILFH